MFWWARYRIAVRRILLGVALFLFAPSVYAIEPWADPDPADPEQRYEIGAIGVSANAEYRAQYTFVNPIALNSETDRRFSQIEHRGRFGVTIDYDQVVKMTTSVDVLDGVLWGDNGTFGGDPGSDSGLQVTTRDPNVVKSCFKYVTGDPLKASSYGFGLCQASPLFVRKLFAQVTTPIGAIRVGRQPSGIGMGVQQTDGDGRRNRFGVAYRGDMADRILFATKPLEALKPKAERDNSELNGLVVAVLYDRLVSDKAKVFEDDVQQVAMALRFLHPDGYGPGRDYHALLYYAHRWNNLYATYVNAFGGRLAGRFGDFHVGIDAVANVGKTREVSQAYSVITNDPVVSQQILQVGARAVARYDTELVTAYLEMDYASGDPDPTPRTRLSQFRFGDDVNVGLLMFEHVLKYQSARASQAAVEIIRQLGAETYPAERINTRGGFTNAFAIFPQVDIRPHKTLLFRGGVLVAWAPEPVNDPVASLQGRDGETIEDDLVNFVGGAPGQFYGVELDGRFQWRFRDHFALDLEGAVLFPGSAFQDINGQAVNSFMTQARTTFFF